MLGNKKILAAALALSLCAAAGCTRTQKGMAIGAGVGAAGGAIIGHQSGHRTEGAAIGAAAGAISGALIGDHVEQKNRAETEERYNRR